MARVKWEVVAVTGKYKAADGQEKSRFTKIGVVMETDKGLRLKMETVPLAWDGWAMLSEPRPKPQSAQQTKDGRRNTFDDMSDDIPWQP